MALAQPLFINIPFSNSGLKTATIPNNDDSGVGNASWEQGFPPETMKQIIDGGVPPRGQDMNGVLNKITLILQYLQSGTPFTYNSTFANSIGGYPRGALVLSTDGETIWRNTTAGNTTNPDNGGTNWVNFLAALGNYLPLAAGASYPLTGTLYSNTASGTSVVLRLSGTGYKEIETLHQDGNRVGLIRMSRTADSNIVSIGAGDSINSPPSGITIVRQLGDGTSSGTVTVSVSDTPPTANNSFRIASTAYVKNCVPVSTGSINQGVYVNASGVVVPMTYTLNADVPSNALFTDHLVEAENINPDNEATYYLLFKSNTAASTAGIQDGIRAIIRQGTATQVGTGEFRAGNNTASGTAGNLKGYIRIYSQNTGYARLQYADTANSTNQTFPATGGTLLNTGTTAFTQTLTSGVELGRIKINNTERVIYGQAVSVSTTGSGNAVTDITASDGELTVTKGTSYLPLSGGTMTGVISRSGVLAQNTGLASSLSLYGGTSTSNGSYLVLYGQNHTSNPGLFRLTATDGTNTRNLIGKPDGTLTWNGAVPAASTDSTQLATTAYVKDCVPVSTGDENTPVYVNANGVVTSTGKSFSSYLPLAGGVMTGAIKSSLNNAVQLTRASGECYVCSAERQDAGYKLHFGIGAGGQNRGIYESSSSTWIVNRDSSGNAFLTAYSPSGGAKTLQINVDGYGYVTTPTQTDSSTKIATTAYVKACVPKSVGSANQPVYTNADGVISACTMNSASSAGLARVTNQALGVYSGDTQATEDNNRNGFSHGYVKYASGLIIQWGGIYCAGASNVDVTFETPFINKPQITFSYNGLGDHLKGIRTVTKTGFNVIVSSDSAGSLVKWIAIGV